MPTRTRGKTIPIKPSRSYLRFAVSGSVCDALHAWTRSPAFVANPRGILVHRVRHVSTYLRDGQESHHHVDYLCGNGCNIDLDAVADALVADPPRGRLLCDFCETKARRLELPTGDKLAGRHVHRGVLVARKVCCGG